MTRFFIFPFVSVVVAGGLGCLDGCGETEWVREGDSSNGDGEAQRTGLLLLLLPLSLLLSVSLVACETSSVRAIPASKLL